MSLEMPICVIAGRRTYWYNYSGTWPSSGGVSVKTVSEIIIYSNQAPTVAPVAAFTGTPVTGTIPHNVVFTDRSTGSSIINRRWDFGDGNISNYATATNPVHRYSSAGTYSVNLTVTNAGGSNSQLRSNYITVSAPPESPVAALPEPRLPGQLLIMWSSPTGLPGHRLSTVAGISVTGISPIMRQRLTLSTGIRLQEPTVLT